MQDIRRDLNSRYVTKTSSYTDEQSQHTYSVQHTHTHVHTYGLSYDLVLVRKKLMLDLLKYIHYSHTEEENTH